jgi:hypothetical protein
MSFSKFAQCLLVFLLSCGGNWSALDLEYANALPHSIDFRVPVASITGDAGSPLPTLGGPSIGAAQFKNETSRYNTVVISMLASIDNALQVPPSERTIDSRLWGPFADSKNTDVQFQLKATRIDVRNFTWAVEASHLSKPFATIVSGVVTHAEAGRKTSGTMAMNVASFRSFISLDDTLSKIDSVDVGYANTTNPTRIDMKFQAPQVPLEASIYTQKNAGSRNQFSFSISSSSTDLSITDVTVLTDASGAGRFTGMVRKGNHTGFSRTECWNERSLTTYFEETWPGGRKIGESSGCSIGPEF